MRVCKVDGCTIKHYGLGYCSKHYNRFRNNGDPLIVKHIAKAPDVMCSVVGCLNKTKIKGFCKSHYLRFLRHGDPMVIKAERHGMSDTLEHKVWAGMKARCYNPNNKEYHNYGGRGIKVCERWLHSFKNFYEDMGPKPFKKAQIDREKNNEDYTPDNCRWVTNAVNQQNRRNNVLNWFTVRSLRRLFAMKKYSIKDLCKIYNLKLSTLEDVVYNKSWKEA